MKRAVLVLLAVLIFTLSLNSVMTAYAEVQLPAYIKFEGFALGACGVFRTFGGGTNAIPVGFGVGSGSVTVNGFSKASSYQTLWYGWDEYFQIYGMAYITAPGDIKTIGFLTVKWFEGCELHQLTVAIYSLANSQGVFQPETDKFLAGFSSSGTTEGLLGYRGVYRVGSNVRCMSGPIGVWVSKGEIPSGPKHEVDYIHVVLIYDEAYVIHIAWVDELVNTQNPITGDTVTVSAAKIFANVKLL